MVRQKKKKWRNSLSCFIYERAEKRQARQILEKVSTPYNLDFALGEARMKGLREKRNGWKVG